MRDLYSLSMAENIVHSLAQQEYNGPGLLGLLAASWLTYLTWKVIYDLFFHPLAGIPGPRSAAIATLYKAYIDCVAKSSFVLTFERLHLRYGEILFSFLADFWRYL